MNSVFALLALFILGLQDFDGNHGITQVSAEDEISNASVDCINQLLMDKYHAMSGSYVQGVLYLSHVKSKLQEHYPNGNGSILRAHKQTAQRCLNQLTRNGDTDAANVLNILNTFGPVNTGY